MALVFCSRCRRRLNVAVDGSFGVSRRILYGELQGLGFAKGLKAFGLQEVSFGWPDQKDFTTQGLR